MLKGHDDYGFSTSWHPNGYYLATGNQDRTCKVWDVRYIKQNSKHSCLKTLLSNVAAVGSVKFSQDGKFLTFSESIDFVHVYDAGTFEDGQVIDFFGKTIGFCYEPGGSETLFLGVDEEAVSGLMEFGRQKGFYNIDNMYM